MQDLAPARGGPAEPLSESEGAEEAGELGEEESEVQDGDENAWMDEADSAEGSV